MNARTVYLSEGGVTGLIIASAEGHQKVVKLLLDAGADLNVFAQKVHTALYHAAENRHEMVVRLLVEAKADVEVKDLDGRTLLHRAATNGHEAVVKLLTDCQVINTEAKDFNYGWTPLFWAADNGHESVVQLLLERGANIKAVDEHGWTPLYVEAANGFESVLELLLDCEGIDIEPKDSRYGWTPLSWAVENGHEPVVRILIERGADIQTQDKNGWTALYGAAMNGHEAVMRLLLENRADVNESDLDGRTVLQRVTAENRQNRAISLLREAGADVDFRDESGITLKLAVAKEKGAIMQVQVDNGNADPSSLLSPPDTASKDFGNRAPSLFQFRYSACNGRRKALLIGINHFGQSAQLTDSIDDVKNLSSFLIEKYEYPRENIIILTDEENSTIQPTKQNILKVSVYQYSINRYNLNNLTLNTGAPRVT